MGKLALKMMPKRKLSTRLTARLGGFARDRRGGMAAVEFAIAGPVFIGLIMSLFEMGLLMFKIAMVDLAVSDAVKFIYAPTSAPNGSMSREDIEKFICNRTVMFNDCEQNIVVELTPVARIGATPDNDAPCIDSEVVDAVEPTVAYNPGAPSAIVFMRVCITTGVVTPGLKYGLGRHLAGDSDTRRQRIIASAAFMNEP